MARVPYLTSDDVSTGDTSACDRNEATWGRVPRPLQRMLHSPDLATAVSDLLKATHAASTLDVVVRELTVLTVARETDNTFEWSFHEPSAIRSGVRPEAVAAIKARAWALLVPDERRIVDYVRAVIDCAVTDVAFGEVESVLGSRGAVELTVTVGFYLMLCATTDALAIDLPEKMAPLLNAESSL